MKRTVRIVRGQKLAVIVRSRQTTAYDGTASAVSSINDKGPFDVLPRHTHFISLIRERVTVQKEDGELKQIVFPYGIMKVKDDTVEVYIGIETNKKIPPS